MARIVLYVSFFVYMVMVLVQKGQCACTEPTVSNGCVTCSDDNSDGEIGNGETCTVTCSNAQMPSTPTVTCDGTGFDDTLACPTTGATTDCSVPTVANGCVLCADDGGDNDAPDDTESCTVTCNPGYGTATATTTCETSTLNPATLTCSQCAIGNCAVCTPDPSACAACEDGFGGDGTACTACTDSNCLTCPAGAGTCTGCAVGYGVVTADNSCGMCTVSNCTKCSTDVTSCTECSAGHRLDSNTCTECDEGCATCTTDASEADDEVCQTCDSGYSLANGACTKDDDSGAPAHLSSAFIIVVSTATLLMRAPVM